MSEHYVSGGAMSTAAPEHQFSRDRIPPTVVEHARQLARNCATIDQVLTPLREQNARALYRRVNFILAGSALDVYGLVRRARSLGFAGLVASHHELAERVGRHDRTCRRATAQLLRLGLLRVVPQFRDGGPATTLGYECSQGRNAYALGVRAIEPRVVPNRGSGGSPNTGQGRKTTDKSSDKTSDTDSDKVSDEMSSLSEGRTRAPQGALVPPSPLWSEHAAPATPKTPPVGGSEVPPTGGDRSAATAAFQQQQQQPAAAAPAPQQAEASNSSSTSRTSGLTAPLAELARVTSRAPLPAERAKPAPAAPRHADDRTRWAREMERAL